MQKAMLSQPMAGKTDAEIIETRNRAIEVLKSEGYEIVKPCLPTNGIAMTR